MLIKKFMLTSRIQVNKKDEVIIMMKYYLRVCFFLTVFIVASEIMSVYAYEEDSRLSGGKEWEDYCVYGNAYYGYENAFNKPIDVEIDELFVSKNNVKLRFSTFATFVDVIGITKGKQYVNLTNYVKAEVEDPSIVEYNRGKIRALKKGSTNIILSYKNCKAVISVTVDETMTDDEITALSLKSIKKENTKLKSVPGPSISDVMNRAYSMKNVSWSPEATFKGNSGTSYYAGTSLHGIPYSQRDPQCNASSFLNYYNDGLNNGFYDINVRKDSNDVAHYDATYGVDCSGLVSLSWNIPRHSTLEFFNHLKNSNDSRFEKIGNYTLSSNASTSSSVSQSQLISAYSSLSAGSAVVKRNTAGGHAMLVAINYPSQSYCVFIESCDDFVNYTTYDYSQLASNGYLPFSVKSSYYNQYN